MRKSAIDRFRRRVDETLAEFFPAALTIAGNSIAGASSPGGRITTEYLEGGESTTYRFPFRIPVASLPVAPIVGTSIDWVVDEAMTLNLEVIECSRRPHEDRWQVICRKRRV